MINFGNNGEAVAAFIRRLDGFRWFSCVGEPTTNDDSLERVDFSFLAANHIDSYAPWGNALLEAERSIDRLVLDTARLGEQDAIQSAVSISGPFVDEFLVSLDEQFPGYYEDTWMYAHELITLPDRLLRGAANEIMLADLDPHLHLFQSLTVWFERGHWPCGWAGTWPEGTLILW